MDWSNDDRLEEVFIHRMSEMLSEKYNVELNEACWMALDFKEILEAADVGIHNVVGII